MVALKKDFIIFNLKVTLDLVFWFMRFDICRAYFTVNSSIYSIKRVHNKCGLYDATDSAKCLAARAVPN